MGFDVSRVAEVQACLLSAPHVADGGQSFARGLTALQRQLGLPLWRASFSLLTKHPEVLWRTVQWHETDGVKALERQHQTMRDTFFTNSPVALLIGD